MRDRSKSFFLGSLLGGLGGVVIGGTLAILFWHDVVSSVSRLVRRLLKRDQEQVNFEILLQ